MNILAVNWSLIELLVAAVLMVFLVAAVGLAWFLGHRTPDESADGKNAQKYWLKDTPEDDTDKPTLRATYNPDPRQEDAVTTAMSAADQAQTQKALPSADEPDPLAVIEPPLGRLWKRTRTAVKVVFVLVSVWLVAVLITIAGGWSVALPHKTSQALTKPTPPAALKFRPHASQKARAKTRRKHRRLVMQYRRELRAYRFQLKHPPRDKRTSLWKLVLIGVPLFATVVVVGGKALAPNLKKPPASDESAE